MTKLLTVLDFETTGLNNPRATQVALLQLNSDLEVVNQFESTINPRVSVEPHILEMTHLTQSQLDRSPTFDAIWQEITPIIANRILVAHNASFDVKVLVNELKHLDHNIDLIESLCTFRFARKLIPEIENHKLATLTQYFGIDHEKAHSALSDTFATYELLKRLHDLNGGSFSDAGVVSTKVWTKEAYSSQVRRAAIATVPFDFMDFEEAIDHFERAISEGYHRVIITGTPEMGKPAIGRAFSSLGLKYIESPAVSDLVFIVKCNKAAGGSKINRGVELGIPIISEETALRLFDYYAQD